MQRLRALAPLLLLCAAQAFAQPAQVVEQKLAMVERVLATSPVAQRVAASQNDAARRHIARARELLGHARSLTSSGQARAADGLLNEAIWEVSRAQQLVPDPATQLAAERARYSQLEESVIGLQRSADKANARASELVDQAGALARADKYAEANRQLEQALGLVLKDASTRLGQTVTYDRRFASKREEFESELARFRSFERLVPLALLEFRPPPEAKVLVDKFVAEAREQRERAETVLPRDAVAAVKGVGEATDALRRALQAAGLVVPQTMGSQ